MGAEPERRLYELVNPSDPITFRATVEEASFIASRMLVGMYFVKDAETGETPSVPEEKAAYEAMWSDAGKIASYAKAYGSFLVGSLSERQLFDDATTRMTAEEARAYRDKYHDRRRSSMNDICGQCWKVAEKIAATEPDEAAA